jgi:NADPH2:quinone reductase
MKAIRVHQFGAADALQYEDAPMPEPKAGEVRIKLAASGLNFVDIYHRSGAYNMPSPFIPGLEGAGVVDAVGPGVTDLHVGDRVAYPSQAASYAEYVTIPADRTVSVPESIDLETAAAVMLQGITAHYLADSTFPIQPGDKTLVHAAAGGVGQLLVQIIKLRGGWVVGTVSTP